MPRHLLQPKRDFLSNAQRASNHEDLILSPAFKEAVQAAMLHYISRLPMSNAADAFKVQGAREFAEELMNIGNETVPQTRNTPDLLTPT